MEKPVEVIIHQGIPPLIPEGHENESGMDGFKIIATEGLYKEGVITLQECFPFTDGTKDIIQEIDLSREMISKLYMEYCFEKVGT